MSKISENYINWIHLRKTLVLRVLQEYANSKGIKIIGDMPIYVGGHSSDVWANQNLFELSFTGEPSLISGVPPDAFSATGQLWGTPLYNWEVKP